MKLKLTKPIIFFDLEATGVDVAKDRIVEISYLKVHPNGLEEQKTYRINPDMKIPAKSTAIHHIKDEDVADCPKFKDVAHAIADDFRGCDIAGYNSNKFDIPMLVEEMLRCDIDLDIRKHSTVDVQTIFHKKESRTLSAAYRFYCDKELVGAHGAMADTMATYEVLQAQLDRYPDLENDIKSLAKFTTQKRVVDYEGRFIFNEKEEVVVNFGKHKGKTLKEVFATDPGYYGWIQRGEFSLDTKRCATLVKLGQL
ncbi:MAG: 3'-5' exonuclease [Paludibacteraceae bacterium]|nr:3'-5' exonuclease [Paludibacteraceae bacterium]